MKNICRTLAFYAKYPDWHTYNHKCQATNRAIKSLVKMGYLEVNEFKQARFTNVCR